MNLIQPALPHESFCHEIIELLTFAPVDEIFKYCERNEKLRGSRFQLLDAILANKTALTYKEFDYLKTICAIEYIADKCLKLPYLTHTILTDDLLMELSKDQTIEEMASKCPNVQQVCLHHWFTQSSLETIVEIVRHFKHLKKIDLHCRDELSQEYLDPPVNLLREIANHCPELEHLDISIHPYLLPEDIVTIAKKCKNLKFLNLSNDELYLENLVEEIFANCENLEHLYLMGCHFNIWDLKEVKCRNLQTLCLDQCVSLAYGRRRQDLPLAKEGLIKIVTCCTNLKIFRYSPYEGVHPDIIHALYTNCKDLEQVKLSNENWSINDLLINCQKTKDLEINFLFKEFSLKTIAQHAHSLEYLYVSGYKINEPIEELEVNWKLKDLSLEIHHDETQHLLGNPKLKSFNFTCLSFVLPYLHKFILCCGQVDLGELLQFSRNCPMLETIELQGCTILDGTGACGEKLQVVALKNCSFDFDISKKLPLVVIE